MAHFAKITNGVVEQVIAIGNNDMLDENGVEQESIGLAFIASIGLEGEWIQTSFNKTFRKNYAYVGCTYDADADVFVAPQPYPSWTLDGNNDWQPPVIRPTDNLKYWWNEETLNWMPQSD